MYIWKADVAYGHTHCSINYYVPLTVIDPNFGRYNVQPWSSTRVLDLCSGSGIQGLFYGLCNEACMEMTLVDIDEIS